MSDSPRMLTTMFSFNYEFQILIFGIFEYILRPHFLLKFDYTISYIQKEVCKQNYPMVFNTNFLDILN